MKPVKYVSRKGKCSSDLLQVFLMCLLKILDEDLQICRYGMKENKDMIKEND